MINPPNVNHSPEYDYLAMNKDENESSDIDAAIEQLKELSCFLSTSSSNIKSFDGTNMKIDGFL